MIKSSVCRGMLVALALCMGMTVVRAAELDSEGYPVVYLRGDFAGTNWAANPEYRFSREGDVYSLTVPSLEGEFKVADSDWSYNFGVDLNQPCELPLTGNTTVSAVREGPNFRGVYSESVTISFRYTDSAHTSLTFSVGESPVEPPIEPPVEDPDTNDYPAVYLRGGVNGWAVDAQYRFKCTNGVYTLTLPSLSGEFKIADAEWGFEFGVDPANPAPDPLSSSVTISALRGGGNFNGAYAGEVTISFSYTDSARTSITFSTGEGPVEPPVEDPDTNNYPAVYLRGGVNGWAVNAQYRFNCSKGVYSLTLPSLNGEFKIADEEWGFEFGVDPANPAPDPLSSSVKVSALRRGGNFNGAYNGQVTISFAYTDSDHTEITFSTDGTIIDPPVVKLTSGTLPVLYINVRDANGNYDNEVINYNLAHKNYFSGEYWLDLNGCEWLADAGFESIGSEEAPLPLEIKARGNWTRIGFSKKPFKLKLGKKQSLLGMSKSKHYAILAHADDCFGWMRNYAGFNLGKRIGLPWTPSQQPVEVIINGDYRGVYFLTESIRVEDGRVEIEALDDMATDPALISGGYLVELDNYDEENQIRLEEQGTSWDFRDMLRITFDTPEEYSSIQRTFITDQFIAMNNFVGQNSDELWQYMDLDDAARYYIVEELMGHTEAYHGSTYLFRDRGENQKWHFSPLWDFGNGFNAPEEDFFFHHGPYGNTWVASLCENGRFKEKVQETWKWFMSNCMEGFYDELSDYARSLKTVADYDYKRWHNVQPPYNGQYVMDNRDMEQHLSHVSQYLRNRTSWMSRTYGDFNNGFFAEPSRDTTPAAPLPPYISTGIENIDPAAGEVEYYNLQGIRVIAPIPGEPCIVRSASGSAIVVR